MKPMSYPFRQYLRALNERSTQVGGIQAGKLFGPAAEVGAQVSGESRRRVISAEQGVAELQLQHQAIAAVYMLALVQAARVLRDDRASRGGQLENVARVECGAHLLVRQARIALL